MKKMIQAFLLFSALISSKAFCIDLDLFIEEKKQHSIFQSRGIEPILTIAQLQEMLYHVEDDLSEVAYLERNDIPEIRAVLEKKRTIIIHHLEDLKNNIRHYELDDDSLTFTEILTVLSCFAVAGIAITGGIFGLKHLKENYPDKWNNAMSHLPSSLQ